MPYIDDDRFVLFLTGVDFLIRSDRAFGEEVANWRIATALDENLAAQSMLTGLPCHRCTPDGGASLALCSGCITGYIQERVQMRWRQYLLERFHDQQRQEVA